MSLPAVKKLFGRSVCRRAGNELRLKRPSPFSLFDLILKTRVFDLACRFKREHTRFSSNCSRISARFRRGAVDDHGAKNSNRISAASVKEEAAARALARARVYALALANRMIKPPKFRSNRHRRLPHRRDRVSACRVERLYQPTSARTRLPMAKKGQRARSETGDGRRNDDCKQTSEREQNGGSAYTRARIRRLAPRKCQVDKKQGREKKMRRKNK